MLDEGSPAMARTKMLHRGSLARKLDLVLRRELKI